jgi:hypothetical protein
MATFVIRKEIVAKSLSRLRSQKTHSLFTGYLCLQQRVHQLSRYVDLQPEFTSFFRKFFYVHNHPLGTPYIKPFTEQKASSKNLWLNENVAGSYAPSSLRPGQPFRKVVQIQDRTYTLPHNHAQLALTHLLYFKPIQIAELSAVIYRDFGFFDSSMTVQDLIEVFAYEFGYLTNSDSRPNSDFHLLYSTDSTKYWEEDWLVTNE